MSNGLKGLAQRVLYMSVEPKRVWGRCEADDENARPLRHGTTSPFFTTGTESGVAVGCAAIGRIYVDGEPREAHDFCFPPVGFDAEVPHAFGVSMLLREGASASPQPTSIDTDANTDGFCCLCAQPQDAAIHQAAKVYVHPDRVWHPRPRLYVRASGAEAYYGEKALALRIELDLLEPANMTADESFQFAERMAMLWTERMVARRAALALPDPPTKKRRKPRTPEQRAAAALKRRLKQCASGSHQWTAVRGEPNQPSSIRCRDCNVLRTASGGSGSGVLIAGGGGGGGGGVAFIAAGSISGSGSIQGPAIVVSGGTGGSGAGTTSGGGTGAVGTGTTSGGGVTLAPSGSPNWVDGWEDEED